MSAKCEVINVPDGCEKCMALCCATGFSLLPDDLFLLSAHLHAVQAAPTTGFQVVDIYLSATVAKCALLSEA
jgi:hypothetical protein